MNSKNVTQSDDIDDLDVVLILLLMLIFGLGLLLLNMLFTEWVFGVVDSPALRFLLSFFTGAAMTIFEIRVIEKWASGNAHNKTGTESE